MLPLFVNLGEFLNTHNFRYQGRETWILCLICPHDVHFDDASRTAETEPTTKKKRTNRNSAEAEAEEAGGGGTAMWWMKVYDSHIHPSPKSDNPCSHQTISASSPQPFLGPPVPNRTPSDPPAPSVPPPLRMLRRVAG